MNRKLILTLAFVAGCAGEKAPVDDSFTDLSGLDEKSDKFTGKMTLVGSIDYDQKLGPFSHRANKWSALKFAGDTGDKITVDVSSSDGDTVAWVLDNDMNIVAFNDDSGSSTNSHIEVTLPKNASRTHYIVTRDYYRQAMHFSVGLQGPATFDSPCKVDSDCTLVQAGCCGNAFVAVRGDRAGAFHDSLHCDPALKCLTPAPPTDRLAECVSNKCVEVAASDIACGGRTVNPHTCPDRYNCVGPNLAVDGTGKCYQNCGGFAGFSCTNSAEQCVDNPYDSCDPNQGGADCPGICVGATADCTLLGCGTGKYCTFCWGSYQCIPEGALC
jgi:hypothetical protein